MRIKHVRSSGSNLNLFDINKVVITVKNISIDNLGEHNLLTACSATCHKMRDFACVALKLFVSARYS